MTRSFRLKILTKIAQTTGDTPTSGAVQAKPVAPDPSVTMESAYPNVQSGYDPARAAIVFQLGNLLNRTINIMTAGKYNAQTLRNKSWQISQDEFPSPDQKNVAMFFKRVFTSLYNNGQPFPQKLNAKELSDKAKDLMQSQELTNLSKLNPTGPVAARISNNLQEEIKGLLRRLSPSAPVPTV